MKKYVKPELFYERYELSTHIASCYFDLNLQNGLCGFKDPDGLYQHAFSIDTAGCQDHPDIKVDDYCYQANGTASDRLTFNS